MVRTSGMPADQAETMALREGNPIIVTCAKAAHAAQCAYSGFAKDAPPMQPWPELTAHARSDVLEDVWVLIQGGTPQDIYARYDHGGIVWDAASPDVQLRYILFARVMADTFAAVSALANAHKAALDRAREEAGHDQ